jgi:hypothetical protein
MKNPTTHRRCVECSGEFVPDPRVKERQVTCGSAQCQRSRHVRQCRAWHAGNAEAPALGHGRRSGVRRLSWQGTQVAGLVPEAAAGEVEGDQAALYFGSHWRSRRLAWPVPLPVRQPVPGCFRTLEHEWKDGSPWLSGDCTDLWHLAPSTSSTAHLRDTAPAADRETLDAVPGGGVLAEPRPEALTAIMEGNPKGIVAAGAPELT